MFVPQTYLFQKYVTKRMKITEAMDWLWTNSDLAPLDPSKASTRFGTSFGPLLVLLVLFESSSLISVNNCE